MEQTDRGAGAKLEATTAACTRNISDQPLVADINAAQYTHPIYTATTSDLLTKIYVDGKAKATIRIPTNATPARPTFS